MYCVNGASRSSLLIESTDSMIITVLLHEVKIIQCYFILTSTLDTVYYCATVSREIFAREVFFPILPLT